MPPPRFADTEVGKSPLLFYMRQFAGINRNVARSAIDDNQFFWLENLMPVAPANLRGMYGEGAILFTASGKTIINAFFYNIQNTPFVILFFSDGTATQVNTVSAATTTVTAAANTFFVGGNLPVAAQWNATGIVIASESSANGFWAWDGTTLTAASAAAPAWLTNGIATTMPSGLHGSTIEIFQNRVWITTPPSTTLSVNQATITNSAPNNGADFTTPDGANIVPQQDASLRFQFVAMRQSNGFLFLLGDSNVASISNVITGGSPLVTTYNNQNVDPQTGCSWLNTAQVFGQGIIFANRQGVYVLAGGVINKISFELDRLFATADFSVVPSAAVAVVFGVKLYFLLMKVPDQNNTMRNVLLCWNTQVWWVCSQVNQTINQIWTQEFNGIMTVWGSDGVNIMPLFQTPNANLQKIMQSKLFSGDEQDKGWLLYKKSYRFYWETFDYSGTGVTLSGTIDSESSATAISIMAMPGLIVFVNNSNGVITFTNGGGGAINWQVGGISVNGNDVACYGLHLGWTQAVMGSDFTITGLALEYSVDAAFLG